MTSASVSRPPALVIGTGFGCRIQVPALRAAGFDVIGLVGTDAERTRRRAEAAGIPHAFTDPEAAIRYTKAKVVTVATPPHTHAALSILAISLGCHVLCEKPFAKDLSEARSVLEAAERAGVVHLMGHEFRWLPERIVLARAVAEGLIGRPRFATFLQYVPFVASPDAKMPSWWFDKQAGGGWLGASGAHIVDQVRITLAEFASVSAALTVVAAREGVAEDSYVARFHLANGVEGVLQQTASAWGPLVSMARIAGTEGSVWIEDGSVKIADHNGTRDLPIPADLALPPPPPSEDPRKRYLTLELGPYTRLCEALLARIEGKTVTSAVPVPTFADGVAGMQVLDAIRRSSANKGALVTLR